jgi:hypothetical protein
MHVDRATATGARTHRPTARSTQTAPRRQRNSTFQRPATPVTARRPRGEAGWRRSAHPPPSRPLSLRSALLRSDRSPTPPGPDRRASSRHPSGSRCPARCRGGPGGPAAARTLECLVGGERATRRGEPSRDVETRRWGPPWEYRSAGGPPSQSRGIALKQISVRRRPSPTSHATPPRRLGRGSPSPNQERTRPAGRSAPRARCPGESGAA